MLRPAEKGNSPPKFMIASRPWGIVAVRSANERWFAERAATITHGKPSPAEIAPPDSESGDFANRVSSSQTSDSKNRSRLA
jgi:hypothetical protein